MSGDFNAHNTKTIDSGQGDLSSIFNFGTKTGATDTATGANTTASGTNALGSALGYFKNLLNGGRTSAMAAIAPALDAGRAQNDAAKREIAASGTSRGGGTAGVEQQADDKTAAAGNDELLQARSGAAGGVATVGSDLAKIGTAQSGLGLQAEDIGNKAATASTDAAVSERASDQAQIASIVKTIFS